MMIHIPKCPKHRKKVIQINGSSYKVMVIFECNCALTFDDKLIENYPKINGAKRNEYISNNI